MDTILGIKIKKHSEGFSLCQSHYVEKVLQRFEHLNIKETNTPFDRSIKLGENTRRAIKLEAWVQSSIGWKLLFLYDFRHNL